MTALVGELTADEKSIVLIANGPDVEVAQMAKLCATLTPLFQKSKPPGALTVAATWPAVVQLAAMFGAYWRPGPRLVEWITQRLMERTRRGRRLTVEPPAGCVARPYQVEAAMLIAAVGRVLLFDDPGTGKTISTILGLVERAASADVLPVLCVVPASTVDSWVEAWQTWAPQWPVLAWRGTPTQRLTLPQRGAAVYVASYGLAAKDGAAVRSPLVRLRAGTVVIDEVHKIKSPHTQQSVAARRLASRSRHMVGLSGTPITHHAGNLWPTLEALEPAAWPSSERWYGRYLATARTDYGADDVVGLDPRSEAELRTALLGQYRHVAKADVLPQLPPKVYSVRTVELPPTYRRIYDAMEDQMLAEMPDGTELPVMSILAQLTRLAQLASAAADVTVSTEIDEDTGEAREHYHVTLKMPSWKVDALLDVLAERPGTHTLAFTPSRQLTVLAGEMAQRAGYSVGYLVGRQTAAERTRSIEHFQAGKFDVLCATTGAGGVGLTLTAASTVVFLQRPWSLVDAIQAEDRAHRIGSEIHDSIEIIDIIAANTIDSRVRQVLREKAGQLAHLLQDRRILTHLLGGSAVRPKGEVA